MSDQLLPSVGGTLPNDTLAFVVDDDVKAVLPAYMQKSDNAPIRDAIIAALTTMATGYQEAATYAAQQRDVLYATGDNLDSLLTIRRHEGELDEDYRTRGLSVRKVVTPAVICEAVNALIAPLTCSYLEPELDQMFVPGVVDDGTDHTGDTTWGSFIGVSPQYQDRLYPDDAAANAGVVKSHVLPGPAAFFNHNAGGYFVLYVPDLSNLNRTIALVFNGTKLYTTDPSPPELGGHFRPDLGNGEALGGTGTFAMTTDPTTDPTLRNYAYNNATSEDARYNQIVDTVERLRGGGFQWILLVQPTP